MRLALEQDDRITRSIRAISRDHLSTLSRKHVEHRQRFLCDLLSISYERRHVHQTEPDACSFSRDFLRKGLRVSASKALIPKYLGGLYSFEQENRGYSRDAGLTKAYRLHEPVRAMLDEVYSGRDPLPIEGEQIPTASENGLPAQVATEGIFVPAHLPVTEAHLGAAEEQIRRWMGLHNHHGLLDPKKTAGMTLQGALQVVRGCKMWWRSFGGFPNLYRLQSHGRLGPRGGTVHVITLPRKIRHLILHRSGLADFDLISCHWSILQSLSRSVGLGTPWIDAYLHRKEDWHAEWADRTGRSPGDFKSITTSWLTGGVLSSSPRTAGARTVGRAAMEFLQADLQAQELHQETIQTLGRVIPEVTEMVRDGRRTVTVNAVGQARETQGLSMGKVISHILTGFEQFAIRAACRSATGLQAIIYDGFIAAPQAVAPMEAAIREESARRLGLTLNLRLKRAPFSFEIADPRDLPPGRRAADRALGPAGRTRRTGTRIRRALGVASRT